jgi:hypothetical protein
MKRITSRVWMAVGASSLLWAGCVQTTYTDADLAAKEAEGAAARRTQANLDEEVGNAGGEGLESLEEEREDMVH